MQQRAEWESIIKRYVLQNRIEMCDYGEECRQHLVLSKWWKKVKEICLKVCGMNKGNGRLMISERSRKRMTEDYRSIAISWDFIVEFIIFFTWFKETIAISDFFPLIFNQTILYLYKWLSSLITITVLKAAESFYKKAEVATYILQVKVRLSRY